MCIRDSLIIDDSNAIKIGEKKLIYWKYLFLILSVHIIKIVYILELVSRRFAEMSTQDGCSTSLKMENKTKVYYFLKQL